MPIITPNQISKDEVIFKLETTCKRFLDRDDYLLNVEANERSLTHKLAEYLQQEFQEWNVDCEYNRDGVETKTIEVLIENINPHDLNAKTVYPDIIIHHRGESGAENNLLVIEAKKSGNDISYDIEKLKQYKEQLGYQYAVQLTFNITKKNIKYDFK